jgi:hypothetical protein
MGVVKQTVKLRIIISAQSSASAPFICTLF